MQNNAITLVRRASLLDIFRKVQLYAGDTPIGALGRNEQLSTGHSSEIVLLVAKIDWCRSEALPVNSPGVFSVRHYWLANGVVATALLIMSAHLLALYLYGYDDLLWLIFIPGLIHLYYITLGRAKYLRITRDMGS